jgi:hypothetical protein
MRRNPAKGRRTGSDQPLQNQGIFQEGHAVQFAQIDDKPLRTLSFQGVLPVGTFQEGKACSGHSRTGGKDSFPAPQQRLDPFPENQQIVRGIKERPFSFFPPSMSLS